MMTTLTIPLRSTPIRAVGIVASAGSIRPFVEILSVLSPEIGATILVLRHFSADVESNLVELLRLHCPLPVEEAHSGDPLLPGTVLVAPGGCHLAIDAAERIELRHGPRIDFVWPSADLLLTSMARAFGERALAVVLSGTGRDGAMGTRAIRNAGGLVLAQEPLSAEYPSMPETAVDVGSVDLVLSVAQIAFAIDRLCAIPDDGEGPFGPSR